MKWSSILHPPWMPNTVATVSSSETLRHAVPFVLPEEYLELLQWSDGGEGPLGEVYFTLWRAEEVPKLNQGYEIQRSLPNVLAIGDDSAHFYGFEFSEAGIEAIRFPMGFMHPTSIDARLPRLRDLLEQLESAELF